MVYRFLLALLIIGHLNASSETWPLQIYTEHFPPFNYVNPQGEPAGLVYDLLVLMLEQMERPDLVDRIEFVPWARGYHETTRQPDTLLFSAVRNYEREKEFIWVGPVTSSTNYLIGRAELLAELPDNYSASDLQALTVGAVRRDFGELVVRQHPILRFAPIQIVGDPRQAALMLKAGHIDLWSYNVPAARHILHSLMEDPDRYLPVFKMGDENDVYFAFNPKTDPAVIQKFRIALQAVTAMNPDTGRSVFQDLEAKYSLQMLPDPAGD